MKIGTALKTVRDHFGITQAEMSRRSKLSQTAISQFESGDKIPSATSIAKICKSLKIPVSLVYLLAMEEGDVP
jgi:transcriptional regulator with XRE-family HTH domain